MEEFIHPQVASGFGFTCDEEILPFITALYVAGMETLGSCQGIHAAASPIAVTSLEVSTTIKGYPRRWIVYTHDDPQVVFEFAQHIRNHLQETTGWGQLIEVDHYSLPDAVFALLEFIPQLDAEILSIIQAWKA